MLLRLAFFAALVAAAQPTAAFSTLYALNASTSVPVMYGGTGNAASFCKTNNTKPSCGFTAQSVNYQTFVGGGSPRTCTQSTDARCTTAALTAIFGSFAGIKAAFCNDAFLVILSDGGPLQTPNLQDILNPPGGNVNNVACVTRTWSLSAFTWKIPLNYTLLSTSTSANNANNASFPNGPGDGSEMYLVNMVTGAPIGLPSAGAIGVTIWGQEWFPTYNNRGLYTPEACETDSCNEHVGQGGGPPHLHGDPFGPYCSYNAKNYTAGAHPPLLGFSLDGPSIYGRYLASGTPGFNVSLDDCGGHVHDAYMYHYHTQVVDAVTDAGGCSDAQNPCWKSDISKIAGFWSGNGGIYTSFCTGSSNYYLASGLTVPSGWGVTAGTSPAATSTTSPPPSPPLPSPPPPSPPPPAALTTSLTLQYPGTSVSAFTPTVLTALSSALATKMSTAAGSPTVQSTVAAARRRGLLTGSTVTSTATFPAGATAAQVTAANSAAVAGASSLSVATITETPTITVSGTTATVTSAAGSITLLARAASPLAAAAAALALGLMLAA